MSQAHNGGGYSKPIHIFRIQMNIFKEVVSHGSYDVVVGTTACHARAWEFGFHRNIMFLPVHM